MHLVAVFFRVTKATFLMKKKKNKYIYMYLFFTFSIFFSLRRLL